MRGRRVPIGVAEAVEASESAGNDAFDTLLVDAAAIAIGGVARGRSELAEIASAGVLADDDDSFKCVGNVSSDRRIVPLVDRCEICFLSHCRLNLCKEEKKHWCSEKKKKVRV